MCAVVADGGAGDEEAWTWWGAGEGPGEASGGEQATGAEGILTGRGPALVRDAFAYEIDDQVGVGQGVGPRAGGAVGLPGDVGGDVWPWSSGESAGVMPVGREVGLEGAPEEAGPSGEDNGLRGGTGRGCHGEWDVQLRNGGPRWWAWSGRRYPKPVPLDRVGRPLTARTAPS